MPAEREWARDEDGDGIREDHNNTSKGSGRAYAIPSAPSGARTRCTYSNTLSFGSVGAHSEPSHAQVWMAVETPAYLANSDLRGCNLLASCYRKLGLRVKLMAAKMQYVGVRGLGGVPSLRGKLLEAHTDIHTISAMRLPRGRWGDYSPFICGFAPPSTLKYLRVPCGITRFASRANRSMCNHTASPRFLHRNKNGSQEKIYSLVHDNAVPLSLQGALCLPPPTR